jgi:hypothetical protein
MKKISLLLTACASFILTTSYCQTSKSQVADKTKSSISTLEGAWLSIDNKSFYMYNDKFFSDIRQDSSGIWQTTHAGSYTVVDDKTITHKIIYSSFPTHIGILHTLEYEIVGDTLTMKWFKKLADSKGQEITANIPKRTQERYVRAKP